MQYYCENKEKFNLDINVINAEDLFVGDNVNQAETKDSASCK